MDLSLTQAFTTKPSVKTMQKLRCRRTSSASLGTTKCKLGVAPRAEVTRLSPDSVSMSVRFMLERVDVGTAHQLNSEQKTESVW